MDGNGRFDLKPGETVALPALPKDILDLIGRGYLVEVSKKPAKIAENKKQPSNGAEKPPVQPMKAPVKAHDGQ